MHRCSESIGAIAAALARAQGELTNPEKSLIATIRSPSPREGDRTFRYASLASGLDIVRKSLGQHEIATLQITAIDENSGQIRLTTLLAHASGEWIASDWPVCAISETATPHRMGAALTYARRYALFALVGIAGEDDLDGPDILNEPGPAIDTPSPSAATNRQPRNGSVRKPPKPLLAAEASAALRDQLIAEIQRLNEAEELALWAHRRLPAKNTLTADDARIVEAAYQVVLGAFNPAADEQGPAELISPAQGSEGDATPMTAAPEDQGPQDQEKVTPLCKPMRRRNTAHLAFVGAQPCLVCQRSPCDAHHLKFAQPRSLGRKVSDEFAVPLCRDHHRELHRQGNESGWWANLQIAPLRMAKELWETTLLQVHRAHDQPHISRDPEIGAAK